MRLSRINAPFSPVRCEKGALLVLRGVARRRNFPLGAGRNAPFAAWNSLFGRLM
jgi:hypothetical protein